MRAKLSHAVAIYVSLALPLVGGCSARKGQPGPVDASINNSAEAGETAALEAALATQSKEVVDLNAEIDRLRSREDQLTDQLKQALRSRPGKTISDQPKPGDSTPAAEATIKKLQDDLRIERQKRTQLEQQLAHLKVETSKPPIPETAGVAPAKPIPPALLPAPPHPIAEAEIPNEHIQPAAPEAPPVPVVAARPSRVEAPPPPNDLARALPLPSGEQAGEVASLRTRGIEQETKHQEAMASLSQVLDADRRRQEDLEAQLVALQTGAPGTEGAVSADSAEVHHLRTRLEDERRKNAELTAKLKLAGRVTDLVFRMQNQAAPQPPAPSQGSRFPEISQMGPDGPGPNSPHQPYTNEDGEVHQPIPPRERNIEGPDQIGGPQQNEVPQAEVPPVFPQGDVQTEETTQD
jgi:hypothetical protein